MVGWSPAGVSDGLLAEVRFGTHAEASARGVQRQRRARPNVHRSAPNRPQSTLKRHSQPRQRRAGRPGSGRSDMPVEPLICDVVRHAPADGQLPPTDRVYSRHH